MSWQKQFTQQIQKIFKDHKAKNSRYSMRSFAKKVGVSPGALSEIMQGKRRVAAQKAESILSLALGDGPELLSAKARLGWTVKLDRQLIQDHQMSFLIDWVSHAVMGFFEIDDPKVTAQWISEKLDVPLDQIEERIERFIDQGFLYRAPKGRVKIKTLGKQWHVPANRPPELMAKFKEAQNKAALYALKKGNPQDSFFSSMTFLGGQEQIEMFQKEIMALYDRIAASVDPSKPKELMRISVQAFPFNFKK